MNQCCALNSTFNEELSMVKKITWCIFILTSQMSMCECKQKVQQQLITAYFCFTINSTYLFDYQFIISCSSTEPHLSVSISLQAAEKWVTDSKELTVTSGLSYFKAKQLSKFWGTGLQCTSAEDCKKTPACFRRQCL